MTRWVQFSFIFLFGFMLVNQGLAETLHVPSMEYPTIQVAVDAASDNDVILVADGVFTENVDVNKQISIQSENGSGSTGVIAATTDDHVFHVMSDYVSIEGFSIGGSRMYAGIYLERGIGNCTIAGNYIAYNTYGIQMDHSNDNIVIDNAFLSNTTFQINVYESHDNTIGLNYCSGSIGASLYRAKRNIIINCLFEEGSGNGITLAYSEDNILSGNTIRAYNTGIHVRTWSDWNIISGNDCYDNEMGIGLYIGSNHNSIYFNNFRNNTNANAYSHNSMNRWFSHFPTTYYYNGKEYVEFIGNYYSDHTLSDPDIDGILNGSYYLPNDEPPDDFPLATNISNFETINYYKDCDIDGADLADFLNAYTNEYLEADLDGNNYINSDDIELFAGQFGLVNCQ